MLTTTVICAPAMKSELPKAVQTLGNLAPDPDAPFRASAISGCQRNRQLSKWM